MIVNQAEEFLLETYPTQQVSSHVRNSLLLFRYLLSLLRKNLAENNINIFKKLLRILGKIHFF